LIVKHLRLRDFRNIAAAELELHPHFTILAGDNGAGKTNILESLYLLANVRSFRPCKTSDLIRIGSTRGRIETAVVRGPLTTEVAVDLEKSRKKFSVNGKAIHKFASYLGTIAAVVFSPGDLYLLQGPANERRRFIDRVVCGAMPAHLDDLQRYEKALRSRNQLLKDPRADRELLDSYTDQLVPLAARIVYRRLGVLDAMQPVLASVFHDIFAPDIQVELRYDCGWTDDELASEIDDLEQQIRAGIESRAHAERRAGHTLVGPHRDDLAATLDGLPTREYASQGQTRSIILALKMTEIAYLETTRGDCPLLLLDDVSSELDKRRNAQLFEFVRGKEGQTVITTTDRSYIQIERDVRAFAVTAGEVSQLAEDV